MAETAVRPRLGRGLSARIPLSTCLFVSSGEVLIYLASIARLRLVVLEERLAAAALAALALEATPEGRFDRALEARLSRDAGVSASTLWRRGAELVLGRIRPVDRVVVSAEWSPWRLVVRPLRRLAARLERFRRHPQDLSPEPAALRRGDEIGIVEQEFVRMQDGLRRALPEKTRLAALGAAVSALAHDLENMPASAVLVSDRFEKSADPSVRQVAPRLVASLDRAIRPCADTSVFARRPAAAAAARALPARPAPRGGPRRGPGPGGDPRLFARDPARARGRSRPRPSPPGAFEAAAQRARGARGAGRDDPTRRPEPERCRDDRGRGRRTGRARGGPRAALHELRPRRRAPGLRPRPRGPSRAPPRRGATFRSPAPAPTGLSWK